MITLSVYQLDFQQVSIVIVIALVENEMLMNLQLFVVFVECVCAFNLSLRSANGGAFVVVVVVIVVVILPRLLLEYDGVDRWW